MESLKVKLIKSDNRFDINSKKRELIFAGNSYPEIFEKIYKYKKTFRYCDDGFEFPDKEDEKSYDNWYKSLSEMKRFNLFYDGCIVD